MYLKLDLVSSNLYPFVMLRKSVISARSQAWAFIRARPVRGNGVMDSISKKNAYSDVVALTLIKTC